MNKASYYKILSEDFPSFFDKYISLPILQRLSGVGLLCGTDWTPLYHNNFFYSRLDHSIGVALIIWHFTKDKAQTISGLLHDVSTPAFSHVTDFRNGDALTQKSTEDTNAAMVASDEDLARCLASDGLTVSQVSDYHIYPIADNEIPRLSADRLEYMFPSGMALDGLWDLVSAKQAYDDIVLCRNEEGLPELGFKTEEIAADYCRRCCDVGLLLLRNENKIAMQLMAEILTQAVNSGIINNEDCFSMSERQLMERFAAAVKTASPQTKSYQEFVRCYNTFRSMTEIQRSETPLPGYFCVSLDVKKRYINPLVVTAAANDILSFDSASLDSRVLKSDALFPAARITDVSGDAAGYVRNFFDFTDTAYGCVRYTC